MVGTIVAEFWQEGRAATGTLILTLTTMWCGLTTNFGSLLAARTIQGMGGGAADAVAPAAIGDMFFIHQRDRAMVSGFH